MSRTVRSILIVLTLLLFGVAFHVHVVARNQPSVGVQPALDPMPAAPACCDHNHDHGHDHD